MKAISSSGKPHHSNESPLAVLSRRSGTTNFRISSFSRCLDEGRPSATGRSIHLRAPRKSALCIFLSGRCGHALQQVAGAVVAVGMPMQGAQVSAKFRISYSELALHVSRRVLFRRTDSVHSLNLEQGVRVFIILQCNRSAKWKASGSGQASLLSRKAPWDRQK